MTASVDRPGWLAARRLGRAALRPLAAARGFRVVGGERLPRRERALLIVSNHAALVDSLYLILAIRPRFVICGARPTYFESSFRRSIMALANVARVAGRDEYLAQTMRLLCSDRLVVTFPEMRRNPDALGTFEPWAAEAAIAIGAPILPVSLAGTTRGHRGPPRLFVGSEIQPEGEARTLTERLRTEILALGPDAPSGDES